MLVIAHKQRRAVIWVRAQLKAAVWSWHLKQSIHANVLNLVFIRKITVYIFFLCYAQCISVSPSKRFMEIKKKYYLSFAKILIFWKKKKMVKLNFYFLYFVELNTSLFKNFIHLIPKAQTTVPLSYSGIYLITAESLPCYN